MKLELKHLAPYLPYGLKMKRNGFMGELFTIKLPKEDSLNDYYEFKVSCSDWWENNVDDLNPYKPVLRPLSDLIKEIEHNGDKFIPIDKINRWGKTEGLYPKVYGFCDREITSDLTTYGGGCWEGGIEEDIDTFQFYELYSKLFEWHFDVFGLIEKGLAIDINTLENV